MLYGQIGFRPQRSASPRACVENGTLVRMSKPDGTIFHSSLPFVRENLDSGCTIVDAVGEKTGSMCTCVLCEKTYAAIDIGPQYDHIIVIDPEIPPGIAHRPKNIHAARL